MLRLSSFLPIPLLAAGCVTVTQVPPPSSALSSSSVVAVAEPAPARPFVGLVLEERLSGSLDDLAFLGGLSVVEVAPGSPAERAGLRAGDLVVEAAGVELDALDAWQAVLDAAEPGARLALVVERERGLADVRVDVERRGGVVPLPERTRFVERVKGRLVVDTVPVEGGVGARVVRLLDGSPFGAAGVAEGEVVLALDGRPVEGARGLVEALAARDVGEELRVRVRDVEGAAVREADVELWAPERHLTGLAAPILFRYERDLVEDETEFALLDLWVLALYDYRRDVRSVRHRVLRWFVFETGAGELVEETP